MKGRGMVRQVQKLYIYDWSKAKKKRWCERKISIKNYKELGNI